MIKKFIVLALLSNALASQAQVFFSEDFETGNLNAWTNVDDDADASNSPGIDFDLWYASNQYANLVAGSDGYAGVSHSQAAPAGTFLPYTPNNFLISSAINLSGVTGSGLRLTFDAGSGQLAGGHAEHYAVYLTTSNQMADITAATPVFEETLPTTSASIMESHSIDISAYNGQTVYLTFRHFNCTNQFNLLIDNISVEKPLNENGSIESAAINRFSLTNTNNTLDINVTNEGSSTITSVTIDWNDGAAHSSTITGLSIAPLATGVASHTIPVTYSTIVEKTLNINLTHVNGVVETDLTNNTTIAYINTVSSHTVKTVVFEEGTGTWCQACPGGTVMMDDLTQSYPNTFAGVTVHVNDPMENLEHAQGSDFYALPSFHADRRLFDQPFSDGQSVYNALAPLEVPVSISTNIYGSGNNAVIEATATFSTIFANADLRLGLIITEDGITGTGALYNQANIYSGGAYGPMGGYENLPDPVPASQMVYDHVSRALVGGYDGQMNSIPTTITDGQVVNYTFNYTVPAGVDVTKLHAVVVVIDQTTGAIMQGKMSPINLATGIKELKTLKTSIYPNPTTDKVTVNFIGEGKDYMISIFDITGKVIVRETLTNQTGNVQHEIMVNQLQKGSYFITVSNDVESSTQKIIVQ